jgi:prevent-host-death family protein
VIRVMSDEQAKEDFGALLDSVNDSNDRVIVERKGKPSVVLLSSEDYDALVRRQIESDWALVQQLRDDNADVDPDVLMRDATEAVEAAREEMFGVNSRADSGND